jgi:hypothetical protein
MEKDRHKKESTSKWLFNIDWDAPVIIACANFKHGGICNPGKQNRVATAQRAGKHVQEMPNNALYIVYSLQLC